MFEIMMPHEGKWTPLPGHGCQTVEEAEQYCASFAGHFVLVKEGEELPPYPQPKPRPPLFKTPMEELSPEHRAARIRVVEYCLKVLREPLPS